MSLETDLLLDRRRLKRRLVFWRVFSVVALVAAVIVGLRGAGLAPAGAHMTRITVQGPDYRRPQADRCHRCAC